MNATSRAILRTLVDADASLSQEERTLLQRAAGGFGDVTDSKPAMPSERRFLRSGSVMALLGYRNRASFWEFVRRKGVPHVRLGPRKIVFDEVALKAWLARRSSA
jgi:predicted DNA-binding transcriptional regulator AlpA